ncbi:hypothetical protein TrVGV298_004507 [Trichoderma virens]|nr:hypothetical protein TrVGV298_004507 [Trichoderma virens]
MGTQIAPLVNRSLASLKVLVESVSSSQDECSIARSHLARFKLWTGGLGAHRSSGGRSLEHRLRDSSFVRNHIVSLLQELLSSIDEGTPVANKDSSAEVTINTGDDADMELELYFQSVNTNEQSKAMIILDEIGHIIDCLLRLSITIRNPAPHDQFSSRAGADTISMYKEWDMKHICEKFNRLDSKLADRLGIALSRRRQYLKYREEHSQKLAHGLYSETDEVDNATTIASSIPKNLNDIDNSTSFLEMDILLDAMSETSATSYALSSAATNELRVPKIPREYIDGPFQCPLCRTIIMIDNRSSWKYESMFLETFSHISAYSTIVRPRTNFIRAVMIGWHI